MNNSVYNVDRPIEKKRMGKHNHMCVMYCIWRYENFILGY
jgi:hypothetical protein